MSRLGSFLFGAICGAIVCFTALKYHVLRTNDGYQFVPKLTANFEETYVDVRKFQVNDWNEHKALVAAIVQAGKSDLLGDSAASSLHEEAKSLLDKLGWRSQAGGESNLR